MIEGGHFPPIARLVAASARRPWLTLLISGILLVGAILYCATNFAISTNTRALFDPNIDWRRNETAVETAFPYLKDVVLVVVDGETAELAEGATQKLVAHMAADRVHFGQIRRPDGGDYFDRQGLLYQSVPEVQAATEGLIKAQPLLAPLAADPTLRGVARSLDTMVVGVENDQVKLADLEGPMRTMAQALDQAAKGQPAWFSWQALLTEEGAPAPPRRRLIMVEPRLDYANLQPGAKTVNAVHALARTLKLDAAHGVSVRVTGEVALADEEFASLEENFGFVGLVMLLAMLITLWLALRSAKLVIAIVITILSGLAIATAIGLMAVGALNLISIAFIPLFVGLGVDFGIQLAVRYNAERIGGAAAMPALERAAAALGASLLLAAGAIFLGFGAFLPTDYVGITELGIIAGLGMVVALGLSLTLLPALIVVMKPAVPARDLNFRKGPVIDQWLLAHRKGILWAFALSMVISIALLPFVRFDFNPLHLRDPDAPAMRTLSALMTDKLRTPNTINVLASNPEAADGIAAKLRKQPEVEAAITIDSFVPGGQDEKLMLIADAALLLEPIVNPFDAPPAPDDGETVAALKITAEGLNRIGQSHDSAPARALAASFTRLAQGDVGMRTRGDAVLVDPLNIVLNQIRAMLLAAPVTRASLPESLKADWVAKDGRALVQIFPKGDSNDNAVLARFTQSVQAVAPDAAGLPVATQAAARTIAWAFVQAGIIALLLVSLLLFAVLRDVREVAFTLAPVVLSGFLTLGSCVLIGQPINFANIIAFPLLFGVGVAFHIYFVMAWRGGATNLISSSLARAVMFSAFATGTAFGATWLSAHPGTASMGKILMISLAWTLVCALIFEPALLGPPRRRDPGTNTP